ncbi:Rieske (2Fe-2S) protein [Kyrpidia spormannii]|uniref:Uncharacterized protein n=2 Tax=Kyrpidia spormannii TaxID=2055160 RepID=A0ACA8ZDQ8_9BACL|nr:non-heme iron oxygenase ferredoxin subunit [Kyrpidia spormannii]CAB3394634.1 conserved protein of unknown function [Kyrpidia spormannii]CAB3395606.1 conserved protein of unknown function [Kyrpidia spormannii]
MAEWVPVFRGEELPPGLMRVVTIGDQRILVANVEGTFYAIGAVCTHTEGYLDEGYIEDRTVVCPIHFSRFSLISGEVVEGPAEEPEPTYPVEVRNGIVYVQR